MIYQIFLLFTTGSRINTGALRPECIEVSVENTLGFFASNCLFELKIPACIPSSADFQLSLKSVVRDNRFTTVCSGSSCYACNNRAVLLK